MPSVSVIIPTRTRASRLPATLAPVLADAGVSEVVVVVDGPDEETHRLLAAIQATAPRLRALRGPGTGPGAARAAGIEAATGDVVVLLDDDVIADPDLASRHGALHATTRQIVIGRLTSEGARSAPDRLYAAAYERWWDAAWRDPAVALQRLWLGNASLRRSDALAIGLDEPAMRGCRHEDRELGIRLARDGFSAITAPDLVATHVHHRTADAFAADCRAEGAGLRALHRLHGVELPPRVPLAGLVARAAAPLADRSLTAARLLRRAAIADGAHQ